MRPLYVLAAAFMFPSSLLAQSAQPMKLVIVWNNQAIAIADYPSLARCRTAAAYLKLRSDEAAQAPIQTFPGGGMITPAPKHIESFCIPG